MRIDEIVVDFPTKKSDLTSKGTVKRSDVIGKAPSGHLVYSDEITGLPYVKNQHDVIYLVDPKTYKLPDHYSEEERKRYSYMVVNHGEGVAYSIHDTEEAAENKAKKLRKWYGKNAEVLPTYG